MSLRNVMVNSPRSSVDGVHVNRDPLKENPEADEKAGEMDSSDT